MPKGQDSNRRKDGKVRTVVFLEPELRKALKVAAAERETSASELVAEALRRYLGVG